MENEFVSYEQALALKEIGFDEPCLGERTSKLKNLHVYVDADEMFTNSRFLEIEKERYEDDDEDDYEEFETSVTAPLYQQAFRWFREKHNLVAEIQAPDGKDGVWNPSIHKVYGFGNYYDYNNGFKTYEEAEQACLDKLIELIKDGTRN